MRGPERIVVATTLAAAACLTGGLAGFGLGLLATVADVERVPGSVVLLALAATVLLDEFVLPLSIRRQVPQLWGRVFSAHTTAVLYGARLGVGPLTVLRTWWWWLGVALGALAGVWISVLVGVVFALARVAAMLAVGTKAGGLRRREPIARAAGLVTALVLGIAVVATATVPSDRVELADTSRSDEADPRAPAVPSTRAAEAAPSPAPVLDPALASRLPENLDGPFRRVPDESSETVGPLDLRRAAEAESDASAERALLETRHFEAGHARAWRDDDGRTAYAAVYRFGSDADAAAYLVDGFITLEGRGARVYDVADPSGGRGFSQAGDASGRTGSVSHGVAFVRGREFFLTFVTAGDSAATVDDAAHLARLVDRWQASTP